MEGALLYAAVATAVAAVVGVAVALVLRAPFASGIVIAVMGAAFIVFDAAGGPAFIRTAMQPTPTPTQEPLQPPQPATGPPIEAVTTTYPNEALPPPAARVEPGDDDPPAPRRSLERAFLEDVDQAEHARPMEERTSPFDFAARRGSALTDVQKMRATSIRRKRASQFARVSALTSRAPMARQQGAWVFLEGDEHVEEALRNTRRRGRERDVGANAPVGVQYG